MAPRALRPGRGRPQGPRRPQTGGLRPDEDPRLHAGRRRRPPGLRGPQGEEDPGPLRGPGRRYPRRPAAPPPRMRPRACMRGVGAARRAFEAHKGKKTLVRYEDLVADTLAAVRRLYS